MQANVKLKTAVPHDADFYIVVQGSMLAHVTAAERQEVEDGLTLSFMVPGMSFSSTHILCSLSCVTVVPRLICVETINHNMYPSHGYDPAHPDRDRLFFL